MDKLEELQQEAFNDNVEVYDYYLGEENLKGFYMNGNIALNTSIDTSTEKACVLAEELGHHHTSVGNILDLQDIRNVKQERKARVWAYDKMIGLIGLIRAYEHGCHGRYEIAEFLGVTEEFLIEAMNYYQTKYGEFTTIDHYIIRFIPYLAVAKIY